MQFISFSRRFAVAAALATMAAPTFAATATSSLSITGTVIPSCSVNTTALNFGATIPTPVNSPIDQQGTITVTCTNSQGYSVALGAGAGAGATVAVRKMTSGTNTLNYSLYTDATRNTVWADVGSPTLTQRVGTGAAQQITVFGRILSGQTPVVGTYSDTVVVTVTF